MLGPAMRIDIVLDMQGVPGKRYFVIDDFYDGLSYTLTNPVYDEGPALRDLTSASLLALPRNPLPELDLTNALRQEIVLQGGMMDSAMPGMMGGPVWAINGTSMTGDSMAGVAPMDRQTG